MNELGGRLMEIRGIVLADYAKVQSWLWRHEKLVSV